MYQPPLFSARATAPRGRLDPESEYLLEGFARWRRAAGAQANTVEREVCQLRSLARAAGSPGSPVPLAALARDPAPAALALREPPAPLARSTNRARLAALQRFLAFTHGDAAAQVIDSLRALLPAERGVTWQRQGVAVAGTLERLRPQGATLSPADLAAIVECAGRVRERGTERTRARDTALVALHCYSGLRPDEAVRLRWEQLSSELTDGGRYGLTAAVQRRGRGLRLPLPDAAAEPLLRLAELGGNAIGQLTGVAFGTGRERRRPMSRRAARDTVRAACTAAGFPRAEAVDLRAAFAYWLRAALGMQDAEVAQVLGAAQVRTVDRLLDRQKKLNAQRAAAEVLAS